MPKLFISYKRGTAAINPLMERLQAENYSLWYDKDDIHAGENWREAINRGVDASDAVIVGLTPAACESQFVQHEVQRGLEKGKLIFPLKLEAIDEGEDPKKLGLTDIQFIDLTADWEGAIARLLADMQRHAPLQVTRHDKRAQRGAAEYVRHQRYLKKLAARIGYLNLAQIYPERGGKVPLERVYIDSPTALSVSVEVHNWHVVDWWFGDGGRLNYRAKPTPPEQKTRPEDLSLTRASLDALINSQIDGPEGAIARYRERYPDRKPDERRNSWRNGTKENVLRLQVQDVAAATDRLVVLGEPGSGKSTFVKHLALCLANAQIDGSDREADLSHLRHWTHGGLLPVYIELRHFVTSQHFPADINTQPTAEHLWAYIQHEILGDELPDYLDELKQDVEQGYAVLIFDGLDEVPYPEGKLKDRQAQLIGLADVLNSDRFAGSRVIVASRPYAYENWQLPGFTSVTITDFADEHRIALARNLYRVAGLSGDDAQEKAERLNEQLRNIDPQLKDRPLFLTMMAEVYLKGESEGLPTRRGALYRQSILLLLDRWTGGKGDSLVDLLGDNSVDDLYRRLAALAYDVHGSYGDQQGTPEIDESLLYKHLKPLGRTTAAELIPYLSENAGVLVSPGQDDQKDVFHFAHRTFQEYLAAAHIAEVCEAADSYAHMCDLITRKPQAWRVPGALLGDVLADTERKSKLWRLLAALMPESDDESPADAEDWWGLWLAAVVVEEQKLDQQEKLDRFTEKPIRDGLIAWLVRLIETPGVLEPIERAQCGRALGLLGDPRQGVGVIVRDGVTLPDIDWVEISGGEFIYGEDDSQQTLKLETFSISRYPITYAQFQTFIDDPEGIADDRWWKGLAVVEIYKQMRNQAFQFANHPRENVNWYQAVAFCRWLSWRLGGIYELDRVMEWLVRLPTEQEWEKAARGTDGRVYPWGDEWDAAKCNNSVDRGQRIGQTSAVGIFPDGASPYEILDMSGNVWEWCLTDYSLGETGDLSNINARVLRGGSWSNFQGYARAAFRLSNYPNSRNNSSGFRVCASPFS